MHSEGLEAFVGRTDLEGRFSGPVDIINFHEYISSQSCNQQNLLCVP